MDITNVKILSILSLGSASIFVGLLPVCFARHGRQQWPLFLSSLLCFGAGVLLATSLIHILPELRPTLRSNAELIFCAGFFILYIIDEIVHFFYGDMHDTSAVLQHSHNSSSRRHSYGTTSEPNQPLLYAKQAPFNPSYRARSDSELCVEGRAPSQLCHVAHEEPCSQTAPAVNIGLLVALSIHALLEGLVVGLEGLPNKVLLLLGAVASHKLVVAFCLGVEIASDTRNTFWRHFIYIFIFTFGSVAGIMIGMIITTMPSGVTDFAIPILQGLAGGTLLYVTVSEVLPRERARWHQQHNQKAAGLYQFVSVVVGFVLMTLLSKYLDYDG